MDSNPRPYLLYLWGFEDTGLNDEHAGDICFYNFHKSLSKLYNVCPQADCFGEREFSGINREFKEMGPQADLCE